MGVASFIERCLEAGLPLDLAIKAGKAFEAEVAVLIPLPSKNAQRQARYRARKAAEAETTVTTVTRVTEHNANNASETVVTAPSRERVVNTKPPSEVVIIPPTSPSETPPPKPKSSPRPTRRAPEGWSPSERTTEALREDGYSPGELERALTMIRDWEFKTPRSDWDAAYRNWVRRDPPARNPHPSHSNVERIDPKRAAREANLARAFAGSEAAARLRAER